MLCPVCGQGDQVQRVSVVVSAQTSTMNASGSIVGAGISTSGSLGVGTGRMGWSGSQRSQLAQLLGTPPRPRTEGGCFGPVLFLFGLFMGIGGVGMARRSVPLGLVALALGIGCVLAGIGMFVRHERAKKQAEARWAAELRVWQDLYFCFRDGTVFHPPSQGRVASDGVRALLQAVVDRE